MDFSALSQSNPRMLQLLNPRQSSQCCPANFSPDPCRGCNTKTQLCQQFVPTNCQCPYNKCVNISAPSSGSGGSGSSTLGGALGGILGALLIAVGLFFIWRQRRNRAKIIQARMQADAKVRAAAAEKFRPGRDGAASVVGQNTNTQTHPGRPLSTVSSKKSTHGTLGGQSASAHGPSSSSGHTAQQQQGGAAQVDPFADPEEDEDTEWTELRADGLTTFKSPTPVGGNTLADAEEEEMLDGLGALAGNRRHSTGAATHLSRITEGAEEDEDEWRSLAPTIRSSFRLSTHAPPLPFDAVSIAQHAAGLTAPASAGGRPSSTFSARTGTSTMSSTPAALLASAPISSATGNLGGNLLVPRSATQPPPSSHRLSTLTTATGISMASSIGDYIIATPETITAEGARRVQLGKSKPQLVRTLSNAKSSRTAASGSGSVDADAEGDAKSGASNGLRDVHVDDDLASVKTR
ncbi:hypothetical protein V8E36_005849 [Tilletia maclaganii]